MSTLLVIHHSPTPSLAALTAQVVAGASDPEIEDVDVVVRAALETTAADLLGADGYVLGTSANFGYMSGALKHVFDSMFLQIGGALDPSGAAGASSGSTAGRPFGLYVHGRYDTVGAVRSVLAITGALGWRQGYGVLEVLGDPTDEHLGSAYELGGTISALLA
ncbi:MAG: flavodoxin [Marmoricola sp.]|nr:flavodoxin [Marmoricola sp.]